MTKALMETIQSVIRDEVPEDMAYDVCFYDGEHAPYAYLMERDGNCATNPPAGLDNKISGILEDIPTDISSIDIYSAPTILTVSIKYYDGRIEESRLYFDPEVLE